VCRLIEFDERDEVPGIADRWLDYH
jgi:hypothetical protein